MVVSELPASGIFMIRSLYSSIEWQVLHSLGDRRNPTPLMVQFWLFFSAEAVKRMYVLSLPCTRIYNSRFYHCGLAFQKFYNSRAKTINKNGCEWLAVPLLGCYAEFVKDFLYSRLPIGAFLSTLQML